MWQRALVSVSDKTGLIELLTPLVREGLKIVSTGGTAEYLRKNDFPVQDVSEITDFPEVLDGRVKTLHPKVHMGLLGRTDQPAHMEVLKKFSVTPFDLVVVNLYPFEKSVHDNVTGDALIEKIDIGGPSMLRSAAKNHRSVAVLCDPNDYSWFLANHQSWSEEKGRRLAAKVFAHTSLYDGLIAQELGLDDATLTPQGGRLVQELRYGENSHQKALWYRWPGARHGLHEAKILQGKELSFNNLLDLEAASRLVREFAEPGAVAVKHNNPCGAAIGISLPAAVKAAVKSDPVSVFGGIIACNREVDGAAADELSALFLECIVAPNFTAEALAIFAKKKNLRLLQWTEMLTAASETEIRSVNGGFLSQDSDSAESVLADWKFHGQPPDQARQSDLIFGEKVCAALKSNAIALVAKGQTIGLGMGQVNRVDAVQQAILRWKTHHPQVPGSEIALISDAFFPFPDSVELAGAEGIRWILQPGGSLKDDEVLAAAQRIGINMVMTGLRHFRH